jgi:anti-anti-sigma regulatory factor
MESKTIKISGLINESLRSRTEAQKVYTAAIDSKERYITIDFSDVCFMSRSFADEFCDVLNQLRTGNKIVTCINESENVEVMLQIVSENRGKARDIKIEGVVREFSNFGDLSNFMATI